MFLFFFNDTATTEIYPLSLHDALPISGVVTRLFRRPLAVFGIVVILVIAVAAIAAPLLAPYDPAEQDRKSTRLNSSHANISYAVFCLKKKKHNDTEMYPYPLHQYTQLL